MRGKDSQNNYLWQPGRITPAYAGKRPCVAVECRESWDHPCVCGEKSKILKGGYRNVGSPLRMRGKAEMGERRKKP